MVKVCFLRWWEIFPATLNFRNCIFPAYPQKGSHFSYEQVIFIKTWLAGCQTQSARGNMVHIVMILHNCHKKIRKCWLLSLWVIIITIFKMVTLVIIVTYRFWSQLQKLVKILTVDHSSHIYLQLFTIVQFWLLLSQSVIIFIIGQNCHIW